MGISVRSDRFRGGFLFLVIVDVIIPKNYFLFLTDLPDFLIVKNSSVRVDSRLFFHFLQQTLFAFVLFSFSVYSAFELPFNQPSLLLCSTVSVKSFSNVKRSNYLCDLCSSKISHWERLGALKKCLVSAQSEKLFIFPLNRT